MANVYVSSTFQDLEKYRAKIRDALRARHHIDIAMEHYGAKDARPLDKCLEDVASCDLYVGLFAWRYGHVPDGQTKSITELEFDQAVETGRHRLLFVARKPGWDLELVELEQLQKTTLLRERVKKDRIVAEFSSIDELHGEFVSALVGWEEEQGLKVSEPILDWDSYRKGIIREHGQVRLNVIAGPRRAEIEPPPLVDVFVPQLGQAKLPRFDVPEFVLESRRKQFEQPGDKDETYQKNGAAPNREIDEDYDIGEEIPEGVFEVIGRERTQVIVGGPGTGKTTLIHYLMLRLSGAGEKNEVPSHLKTKPLPFLIELRQFLLSQEQSFLDYLVVNLPKHYDFQVDVSQLEERLNAAGESIVFFDGLDEVFERAARADVIEQFKSFSRRYRDCQLVVSTRIAGYDPTELQLADFRHYTLLDFNIQQASEFIRRWYTFYTWQGDERNAAGLIQRISENPRLRELAGNPLLLTIMAILYKHQDLPEKRWELYRQATGVLLDDWDIKRKKLTREEVMPLPEGVRIGKDQKARLLEQVSNYMLKRSQPKAELNAIAYDQLTAIIAEFLASEYQRPSGEARDLAAEILNHLRERTFILAEIGEQIYGFVHRTFMEYFAASQIEYEFYNRKSDYGWLTKKVFAAHWQKDQWREVLLLLIAKLADRGSPVGEIIEHLDGIRKRRPLLNTTFAAECLAEAGGPDQILADRLFEKLADEIADMIESKGPTYRNFIDEALRVFALLATTAVVPARITAAVRRLRKIDTDRSRVAAWELEFAMKDGETRFQYALETATSDSEEAIRRGALLVLEREWPGRAEVREVLLKTLRSAKYARTQQVAMDVLERGWPNDSEILEAIASRLGEKLTYTKGVRFIDYIARRWRNNDRAFDLILAISESSFKALDYDDVEERIESHMVKAMSRGWTDRIDLVQQLTAETDERRQRMGRRALVEGWPTTPETGEALIAVLRPDLPQEDIIELAADLSIAKPGDPELSGRLQTWALQRLEEDSGEQQQLGSLLAATVYDPDASKGLLYKAIEKSEVDSVRAGAVCFCFGDYNLILISLLEIGWEGTMYDLIYWIPIRPSSWSWILQAVHEVFREIGQYDTSFFSPEDSLRATNIRFSYSYRLRDLLTRKERPTVDTNLLLWMSKRARSDRAPFVRYAIIAQLANYDMNHDLVQSLLEDRATKDENRVVKSLAAVLKMGRPPVSVSWPDIWEDRVSSPTWVKERLAELN